MNLDPVREFIAREFLGGTDPAALTATTPLISSGVIDSVGTLRLVLFLEQTFGIEVDAAQIAAGRLDTLAAIAELLEAELSAD